MPEGPIAAQIRRKLTAGLDPVRLEIEDDSARHAGHHRHGGIDGEPGGESHFNVTVVSEAFTGRSRVERQRLVNRLLAQELAGSVHALSIQTSAPGEDSAPPFTGS